MRLILMILTLASAFASTPAFSADLCGSTKYYMSRHDLPGDRVLFEGVRVNTDLSSYFFSVDSDGAALCTLLGAGQFLSQSSFTSKGRLMSMNKAGEMDLYAGPSNEAIFGLLCHR